MNNTWFLQQECLNCRSNNMPIFQSPSNSFSFRESGRIVFKRSEKNLCELRKSTRVVIYPKNFNFNYLLQSLLTKLQSRKFLRCTFDTHIIELSLSEQQQSIAFRKRIAVQRPTMQKWQCPTSPQTKLYAVCISRMILGNLEVLRYRHPLLQV